MLTVIEPPEILQNLENLSVVEEEPADFKFTTEKNINSKISYVDWYFNGKLIDTSNENYKIENVEETETSLHYLRVMRPNSLLHEGNYYAKIIDDNGLEKETKKVKLDISYKPKFKEQPENQFRVSGSESCRF